MPIPLLVAGTVVVGAYLIGRFFKKDRENHLEDHLNISESMRTREKQKTREEILKELKGD